MVRLLIVPVLLAVLAVPAVADEPSLEAWPLLESAEMVTAASKRPQPLSETPSLVTVVTRAEIEALGYHTLADALRWVRGMFVSEDHNYSYLGVRGLLRPGDYNNKVLLTIDGHSINGAAFGDAPLDDELGLDMENVHRIEIVRGPGSALYGSHAVLAVVNIVTQQPRAAPGATVAARAGSGRERRGYAAFGSAEPGRPQWFVGGSLLNARGLDRYFPEYDMPETGGGLAIDADGEEAYALFGAMSWKRARLVVKFNDRMKRVPTAPFGTTFGDRRTRTNDGYNFIELSAAQTWGRTTETVARAYWDGARYHGTYFYDYGDGPVENLDIGKADVLGGEWRMNWLAAPGHHVTAGVEGRYELHVDLVNYDVDPYLSYVDHRYRSRTLALYAQDEWRAGRRLIVTGGARLDRDSRFGYELSPRLDAAWKLAPTTSVKLLGGSAFRGPNYNEYDVVSEAHPAPEHVVTLEGALEHGWSAVTGSLSAYRTALLDRIDLVAVDSLGFSTYLNRGSSVSRGVEGEVRVNAVHGIQARAALAWQRSEDDDNDLENSPHWNGHLVAMRRTDSFPIVFGGGVRWLSSRLTQSGAHTAAAVLADARIGWRPYPGATVGFEARNVFDARVSDPASLSVMLDRIEQNPRTLFLTFSFRHGEAP